MKKIYLLILFLSTILFTYPQVIHAYCPEGLTCTPSTNFTISSSGVLIINDIGCNNDEYFKIHKEDHTGSPYDVTHGLSCPSIPVAEYGTCDSGKLYTATAWDEETMPVETFYTYNFYCDNEIYHANEIPSCSTLLNPSSCEEYSDFCWWDSLITHTCLSQEGITQPCTTYTSQETCETEEERCHWQTTPLITPTCLNNVIFTPDSPSFEECDEVPVVGWFTLPETFDIPCQLHNAFIGLFVDDPNDISSAFYQIRDSILNSFPIGYITRFIEILSLDDIVEPPAITYSTGSIIQGIGITGTYTVQPFDSLTTINNIVSDTDGKGIWDIFMPFWNIMVYLSLFLVILKALMGFHFAKTYKSTNKKTKKQ